MNTNILLFLNIGGPETMLIVFAILLLFGGKKLPELARGLGKGIREFKDASDDVKREIQRNINAVQTDIDEVKKLDIAKDLDIAKELDIDSALEVNSTNKKITPVNGETI